MYKYIQKTDLAAIIACKSPVLFLQGPNGHGKTAMLSELQPEMSVELGKDVEIMCVDLTQDDPSNIAGLLYLKDAVVGEDVYKVAAHTIPTWLMTAYRNDLVGKATLVIFDEYNRLLHEVRNALSGALLHYRLHEHIVPDSVYFALTGNLGEDDGNIVEELDRSHKGRVLIIKVGMTYEEWLTHYALPNDVHPYVIAFVRKHPEYFAKDLTSPRRWTKMSEHLKLYGKERMAHLIGLTVHGMLGNEVGAAFHEFVRKIDHFSFQDVIDDPSIVQYIDPIQIEPAIPEIRRHIQKLLVPAADKRCASNGCIVKAELSERDNQVIAALIAILSVCPVDMKAAIIKQSVDVLTAAVDSFRDMKVFWVIFEDYRDVVNTVCEVHSVNVAEF